MPEYGVHAVELAVSCLGHEAESLMRRGKEPESQLLVNFSGGRTAVINVYDHPKTVFAAAVTTDQETRHVTVDMQPLFINAAAAMLDLFEAGKPTVDRRETLAVMSILEAARDPKAMESFVRI
jgi:hypothetical protein